LLAPICLASGCVSAESSDGEETDSSQEPTIAYRPSLPAASGPEAGGTTGPTEPDPSRDEEASLGAYDLEVSVRNVVDGDTLEISPEVFVGFSIVRLNGVDAPEAPGYLYGAQPYGEEAREFAGERLEGRRVALEFDEQPTDGPRLLAYVYLDDGRMFNEMLLKEGYAQLWTPPPNTRYLKRFTEAQREAREARRGLWGLPEEELCRLAYRGNGIGGWCAAPEPTSFSGAPEESSR
jgi:micrococcal nuclease